MNKQVESVEQYLNEVSMHLGGIADKEQIINELRTHIWDLANQLSIEKGLSVQDAFDHAILRMEKPRNLALKFLDEEPSPRKTDWRTPITIPETKIRNDQFLLIALVGVVGVAIMALIISFTTRSDSLITVATILSFIFGILAIGMFIAVLYFYDEKLFREQIEKLRETFLKPLEEKKAQITEKKQNSMFISKIPTKVKTPSFWSALFEHLGGLFGAFFISLVFIFFFIIDVMDVVPLYNDNWDSIGLIAFYGLLGAGFVKSVFELIFGRIRATRLVCAFASMAAVLCCIILIIFYPFTVESALTSIYPDMIISFNMDSIGIDSIETGVKVIIGIFGIFQFLFVLYNIFKFGAWKPSDRKSLI